MVITQSTAEQKLCKLIQPRSFRYQEWEGKKFSRFKFASSTEKGDIGEDFLADLLRDLGYSGVEVVRNRRGPYDVRVRHGKKDVKFEAKVAARDIHQSFQFGGIRLDTKYSHLFCLGISPTTILYQVIPKSWLNNRDGYMVTPMQKGANSSFKLTKREDQLLSFDKFKHDVTELLGKL